jgi:hypothetical protein
VFAGREFSAQNPWHRTGDYWIKRKTNSFFCSVPATAQNKKTGKENGIYFA